MTGIAAVGVRANLSAMILRSVGLAVSLAVAAGAAQGSMPTEATGRPRLEPLDYAFRFASAIRADSKDRAKAQELVISEYAQAGDFEEAIRLADAIEGWRRGTAYADLGAALAGQGRADEARALLEKAEAIRSSEHGWEGERIAAHAAQTAAMLGQVERAESLGAGLAAGDPGQYAGRAAVALASGRATGGDFAGAMGELASLGKNNDLEVSWWRCSGYLAVARNANLTSEQRLRALDAARKSAELIPGERRVEALEAIAQEYLDLDRRRRAREALGAAYALLATMPSRSLETVAFLPALARSWARAGDGRRALRLLEEAEPLAGEALVIDRPGIYAAIASGYHEMGVGAEASRLFDRSLAEAAALENARPRALAVAAICRQMGRHGIPLDDSTRARLDALFAGLGDPW